ncbi:hypothetical protein SAMN04488028_1108 [Reichenbachiella agariperforans]|uniref:Uncharacterized protein n=1 Tax=Reichenbachiella agariperforans TaxID=156994 RepID=A0A1M6VV70_REIAG|nr:hypothetical protein SAMN04488028_1108 [Reichenbachiella agariperforans]
MLRKKQKSLSSALLLSVKIKKSENQYLVYVVNYFNSNVDFLSPILTVNSPASKVFWLSALM